MLLGRLLLSIGFALIAHAAPSYAANRLILNEALANEPGGATSLEWVEVLNWPDSGDAISLDGYILIDGADTTKFTDPLTLAPGGFAVLARRTIGESSFESRWGNSSGVWGDHPIESFPLLPADISLRNSSDTLVLIAPTGDTSVILWTRDTGDGISIERIRPNGDDSPSAFASCIELLGSTPGAANSLLPNPGDAALDSVVVHQPELYWGQEFSISISVTNIGIGEITWLTLELYDDQVPATEGDSLRFLRHATLGPIPEGSSTGVAFRWEDAAPGPHRLIARITSDGNVSNNTATRDIVVRFTAPLVIVSEYLADPEIGGPDEWIEISNRAEFAINMDGCAIGDSTGLSTLPAGAGLIQPGEFWVFAENEAAFRSHFPNFSGRLIQVSNWRSLNNTGDRIRLIGPAGEIIDSLSYRGGNGANRSEERVDLSPVLLDERYWSPSEHRDGATPGEANSVFPIEFDLALDSVFISPESPQWGGSAALGIRLSNVGLRPFPHTYGARVYEDLDPTSPGAVLELLAEFTWTSHDSLAIGAVVLHEVPWEDPTPGLHRLKVELFPDDNDANNSQLVTTAVRHTQPLIIITEFLANPASPGPGEWIELYNTTEFPVNMFVTKIGDSSSSSVISPIAGSISPGSYWVVCEDAASFMAHYPDFDGTLFEVSVWRSLGNGGDGIRLFGAAGEIIDSLTYTATHGNNLSAERLNLESRFSQPGDWTASVDPRGATPGRPNSVQGELAGTFDVEVTPNPFYLTRGEEVEIAYRLEVGERLTLKVFDRAGRLVRTLADDAPSATGSTLWDGRTDGGGIVDPGPYVLLARSEPEGAKRKIVVVVGP